VDDGRDGEDDGDAVWMVRTARMMRMVGMR
jgi:hypothetical protein